MKPQEGERTTKKHILQSEINHELRRLEQHLIKDFVREFKRVDIKDPSLLHIFGMAGFLQSFYNGVERMLVKIISHIDKDLPEGADWQLQLLDRACMDIEGVRKAIITTELRRTLRDYAGFRFKFRYLYGTELEWERILPLLDDLMKVYIAFRNQTDEFFKNYNAGVRG